MRNLLKLIRWMLLGLVRSHELAFAASGAGNRVGVRAGPA